MIHTRRFGQGPRKALLIHCALAHSGVWRAMAAGLSDRLTMTAMDLPGHGRSPDWDGQSDLHDVSTQAALSCLTSLNAAGTDQTEPPAAPTPVDLIGHSFGATIALRLALEHPASVRSVTLIEPVFFAAAKRLSPDVFSQYLSESQPFADAMHNGDLTAAAQHFTSIWGTGVPWAQLSQATQDDQAKRMPLIIASEGFLIDDNRKCLADGVLEGCQVPTLLIRGEDSPPIIPAISNGLCSRLPNAQEHAVAGASHMVPITHPQNVSERIQAFLDSI